MFCPLFKLSDSFLLLILRVLCIYAGYKYIIRYKFYNYFLPACELSFYSLKSVFWRAEGFHFNEEQFFYQLCFGVIYRKSLPNQGHTDSLLYSTSCTVLGFIFRSMIHF